MRYRKKPVVIEAAQWFKNGDHPDDYRDSRVGMENPEGRMGCLVEYSGAHAKAQEWEGGIVRYFRRPDISGAALCRHCNVRMHEHGWIDTKEGGHIVCPGDFVITGVRGEMYPCKPDIFDETYEPESGAGL